MNASEKNVADLAEQMKWLGNKALRMGVLVRQLADQIWRIWRSSEGNAEIGMRNAEVRTQDRGIANVHGVEGLDGVEGVDGVDGVEGVDGVAIFQGEFNVSGESKLVDVVDGLEGIGVLEGC